VTLGLVWMAIPFLLFPLAEQTTSSAVAGMINGSLPVMTVFVTALFTRTRPSWFRISAVTIGFLGIALISIGSLGEGGGADARGIAYLILAVLSYAVAVNISAPLQRRYGSLPVVLHIQVAAILWTLPAGLQGLEESDVTIEAIAALAVLGALGTGVAFAVYGYLLARTGPVRGMIGTFFTPIVATVLGVVFRDEPLGILAVVGMFVVIVGAAMTSRPEAVGGRPTVTGAVSPPATRPR
jgi:drug/metabolite transporter (DMT)-like permease